MHFLYLDLETRSEVDVREVGPFVYAEHPSTEIICCAMALDDGTVIVWKGFDFEDGDVGLEETLFSLAGEDAVFVAHNDDFEKCVLSEKVTGRVLKREWLDTAAMSARLALPRALDELAVFLFPTKPEYHKDADGNRAMMQLTSPRRPSKENLDRFWTPVTRPEVFQRTYDYCARDVVVMRACHQKMLTFPFAHAVEPGSTMEPQEKAIHALTVEANWRGVKVDVQAARQLRAYLDSKTIPLEAEFVADAGCLVKSPVKVAKALGLPDAKRYTVRNALKQDPNNRLLQLLRKLSGSAASKIDAFVRRTSADGRLRGALVYAGAERTSRWSSWGVQLHNMKRGLGPLTEEAFTALQCGCLEQFEGTERQAPELPCDDVTVVGEIIRGLILGPWIVGDYSQIEARGTAWLAGQEDLLRIFREGGDPYCQMASRIYGRTITKKDKSERFMGKQVVLGCFEPDTLVLTHRGWRPIVAVQVSDKVWDGESWVTHGGVLCQGEREVVSFQGIGVTPDHLFWTGDTWAEWAFLVKSSHLFQLALSFAKGAPAAADGELHRQPTSVRQSVVYDIADAGPRNRFTVLTAAGPMIAHNCGYGMSDHRFVAMLDEICDVQVTRDFGKRAVNIYRSTNARIPLLWRTLDNGFTAVIAGSMKKVKVGPLFMGTIKHDGVPWAWIQLPSGRKLWYANAHVTSRGVRYYGRNIYKGGAWELVDTHGGKLVENCFVGGCKVLTSEGMLAIAEVRPGAKVWDGEEWVTTEGARCRGLQEVGKWLGVQVTRNHLIHDGVSWKRVTDLDEHASLQCLAWGRASVRSLCSQVSRENTGKPSVGAIVGACGQVMRESCAAGDLLAPAVVGKERENCASTRNSLPLFQTAGFDRCGGGGTRESLPDAITLDMLRTGTMAGAESGFVRNGDGAGSRFSSTRRLSSGGTTSRSISTGSTTTKGISRETSACAQEVRTLETAGATRSSRILGRSFPRQVLPRDSAPSGQSERCTTISPTVEAQSGLWTDTGKRELVWDLVNCGPRNRFVVLTDAGPVIVHNCVQAMSRDFLAEAMLRLAAAGYKVDLTVHDEIVCEDEGQDIEDFKAKMLVPPTWVGGFPLDVECFKCRRYRK